MAGNDDPEADTEWNAVLREKGILGPKKEVEITEAEIEAMMDKAIEDKYGPRRMEDVEDLDELDELFQDDGKTDDRVLEQYKRQRIREMRAYAEKAIYGTLEEFSKPDYTRLVNDASKAGKPRHVVVLLYSQHSIPASRLVENYFKTIAAKYPTIRFLKIVGDQCIENYPDKNIPTVLVYSDGELVSNLVGIGMLGGMNTTVKHLENILLSLKVIDVIKPSVSASASYGGDEGEDEEEGDERRFRSIRVDKAAASAKRNEEDDDDWD